MKQALILAAGRGARLDRPNTPKPLVDVGGQPMIVRLIKQLKHQGIETIHIVVGYHAKKIMHVLSGYFGYETGLIFHVAPDWEMGSAYSVLAAKEKIRGNFLLAMADHVFDDGLIKKMAGLNHGPNEVMALVESATPHPERDKTALKVRVSDSRQITDLGMQLNNGNGIDAGLFAASSVLFDVLSGITSRRGYAELIDGLKILARTDGLFACFTEKNKWFDVDTPADVIRAEMHLRDTQRQKEIRSIPVSSPLKPGRCFDYRIQTDQRTQMIVQRGIVTAPDQYPIIPASSASSPIFLFTDETVGALYANRFVSRLRRQGYNIHAITLPDGEEAKTISNYVYLVERVLARGVDERSVFISLGGGVVCNVCGFVASTIYRGLELIHIPTTLMAQCDAAISHKQGINGHFGKNMVGAYYSPSKVLVDVEVLQTLTDRQIRDGFAEVIKHAICQDEAFGEFLWTYQGSIRALDFLETVIERNVMLKCDLVKKDPKEQQEAMVLQYGHTAGHPLEHLSGYVLCHGEAVAIGMMMAARVAYLLGACSQKVVDWHLRLLKKFGLPTEIPREIMYPDFIDAMRFNKRYVAEGSQMALVEALGALWCVDGKTAIPVSDSIISAAFRQIRNENFSLNDLTQKKELNQWQQVGS